MEYYSAVKKNEILPLAVTWAELHSDAKWNELPNDGKGSKSEKDKYSMVSLICGI